MTLQTSKLLNYIDSPIVIPYFAFFIWTWVYLRHYVNLQILFSILPLPSPFPDHINAQIIDFAAAAWTQGDKVIGPVLAKSIEAASPFATRFAVTFPQTAERVSSVFASIYNVATGPIGKGQFAGIGPYTLDWAGQQYKCWISQYITFVLLAAIQALNIFWLFLIIRIVWRMLRSFGAEVADERSEYDTEEEEERKSDLKAELEAEAAAAANKEGNPTVTLNGNPV
jgi:acyl-CoA-dependent ceramide synthase